MPDSEVAASSSAVVPSGGREQHLQAALEASHVWVQLSGAGDEQEQIEREVALLSPYVQREVLRSGHGVSEEHPVILPKQVTQEVLQLLLTYCRYHRVPGHSDKERKAFDEKFIRLDTRRLCELTSAADSLEMKPLVDLTSRALARMIEGKTPEEIRATFKLPDDLTEEEKLEPLKSGLADARIKLLNKLYAKKRQSLAVKKAAIGKLPAPMASVPADDDRSLDQLLNFIQDGSAGSGKGKGKGKKKRRGKKGLESGSGADGSGDGGALAAANGSGARSNGHASFASQPQPQQSTSAALATPQPVALERRAVADVDAAQPGHVHQIGDDNAISDLARRLQDEWQVPRAETVSVLTSLRDFRARLPNGGACSGSDAETTDSGSEYSDDDLSADSETDENVKVVMASRPQSASSARQVQPAAQPPAQATAQPDSEAARLAAPVAHASNGVTPPSSAPGPERPLERLSQAAAAPVSRPANGVKPTAAALARAAEAEASAGSERIGGSAAASDAASDSTAVSTTATAGSSRASALSGMPNSSDFQALSGVLRQFLKAVEGTSLLDADKSAVQSARLHLVRGMDGNLEARTASGASVQLSWQFAQPSANT